MAQMHEVDWPSGHSAEPLFEALMRHGDTVEASGLELSGVSLRGRKRPAGALAGPVGSRCGVRGGSGGLG